MATAKRLPSGNWHILQYDKIVDGKRKYMSFTAPTKNEVEHMAIMYKIQKKNTKASGITVGEAIDRYIKSKDSVLSPRTVRGYEKLRKNALVELMDIRLNSLANEQIQIAVNNYSKTHAPKTVRNAYGLLTSALKMHHPDFRVNASLPQKLKHEMIVPDDNAVKQLLESSQGTEMYTVILLATALGLRRSEMCALEWTDLNDRAGTLRINKALVMNPDGKWVVKTTKTTSSTRTMSVPPFLMKHLKSLKRAGKRIIFIESPESVTLRFIRLRDSLGYTMRLHDLRHYYASLMLALGIPDKYAAARMGHATTNMLQTVYQHLNRDKEKEIDRAVSDKLSSVFGQ